MGVNEDIKAVFSGLGHHLVQIVQVFFIVDARALMLNGFPGGEKAQAVKAPGTQAGIMPIRLCQRKGPARKGDIPMVKKPILDMAGQIRFVWSFGTTPQVYPPEEHLPPLLVQEIHSLGFDHCSHSLISSLAFISIWKSIIPAHSPVGYLFCWYAGRGDPPPPKKQPLRLRFIPE